MMKTVRYSVLIATLLMLISNVLGFTNLSVFEALSPILAYIAIYILGLIVILIYVSRTRNPNK